MRPNLLNWLRTRQSHDCKIDPMLAEFIQMEKIKMADLTQLVTAVQHLTDAVKALKSQKGIDQEKIDALTAENKMLKDKAAEEQPAIDALAHTAEEEAAAALDVGGSTGGII